MTCKNDYLIVTENNIFILVITNINYNLSKSKSNYYNLYLKYIFLL